MKEIGGYLDMDDFCGVEFYSNLQKLNTARNALIYLCKARRIKKLYLPYFLCDSVAGVCKREGVEYEQYAIRTDFMPDFSREIKTGEYLYLVNYYGQLSNDKIRTIQEKYGNIIVDNVQAFFQEPIKDVDTIYSCRKFFGVPDGAYLSTNAVLAEQLGSDRSANRMRHILGRYEGTASDYYADMKKNDESFKVVPLMRMSNLTQNLLKAIDYESIRARREANWKVLHEALGNKNPLKVHCPIGPYAYPFYCTNGMEVKKQLATKKIYVATLWPNVLQLDGSLEKDYAENILPLPCDQRYTEADMIRIVEEVKACIG